MNSVDEKKIKFYARKYFRSEEDRKDCVQEIITRKLEGKHQNATTFQALIDYLRTYRVDYRTSHYELQKNLFYAQSIDEQEIETSSEEEIIDKIDTQTLFQTIQNKLTLRHEKIIFGLIYQWGFEEVEIAHLFGVSPTRISQWHQRIQTKIRYRIHQIKNCHRSQLSKKNTSKMETVVHKKNSLHRYRMELPQIQSLEGEKSFTAKTYSEKSF